MHGVWSHWSPVHERSRLATIAFSGSYVGTVISLVVSGFLAQHLGWPSIFYTFGVIALLWTVLWLTNVGETPAEDKRISEEEINYIQTSIGDSGSNVVRGLTLTILVTYFWCHDLFIYFFKSKRTAALVN